MKNNNVIFENGLAFRLAVEQIKFRNWLLEQPETVILKRSKELMVRERIICSLEQNIQKWLVLNSIPDPLAFLHSFYELVENEICPYQHKIEQETCLHAKLLLSEASL